MIKRTLITVGGIVAAVGLTVFAAGVTQGGTSVHAQETETPESTTTAGADTTRTPGPLTPVTTPTAGGTGGASGSPTVQSQLPETGTGDGGSGTGSLAVLGLLVAAAGAGVIGFGMQRRAQ